MLSSGTMTQCLAHRSGQRKAERNPYRSAAEPDPLIMSHRSDRRIPSPAATERVVGREDVFDELLPRRVHPFLIRSERDHAGPVAAANQETRMDSPMIVAGRESRGCEPGAQWMFAPCRNNDTQGGERALQQSRRSRCGRFRFGPGVKSRPSSNTSRQAGGIAPSHNCCCGAIRPVR